MNSLLTFLKKHAVALSVLLIVPGTTAFAVLIVFNVIPAKVEKDNVLQLLEEGGAFAASELEVPTAIFNRHARKIIDDKSGIASVHDIFSASRPLPVELEESEDAEGGATEESPADNTPSTEEATE